MHKTEIESELVLVLWPWGQIFYDLVADDWRAGNENLIDEVYATVISSSP